MNACRYYLIFLTTVTSIIIIALTGCSHHVYFSKPNTSDQEYYKDKSECHAFANLGQSRAMEQIYYTGDDAFASGYNTAAAIISNSDSDFEELYVDCMRGRGYKVSYRKPERLTLFQKAEQGDANSQNNLGAKYAKGEEVEQNYQEAFKWYKKAAEQGHDLAQYNVARLYYLGKGVERNYEEAFKWWMKAAEQGDADAQFGLGQMYRMGQGVEQDDQEAIKWYKKAAEQGNTEAQKNLDSLLSKNQVNKQKRTAESSKKSSKDKKYKKNVVGLGEYCSYHGDCERGLACNESKMCEDVNRYLQRQLSQGKFGKPCSKHTDCTEDGTLCDQQFNKCIETLLWRQKYKDENNKEITVK